MRNVDPSGLQTLNEQSQTVNVNATLQTRAIPNAGKQFAGRAANRAGKAFEKKIEDAIRQCLRPGARIRPGGRLPTNDGRNAMPDFLLEMGGKFKYLEVKTKLPVSSLGDSLDRAAKQLQAAIDNDKLIGILTKTKHRDGTLATRQAAIRDKLSGDKTSMASFLNGTMALVSFVSEFVVEECLENALR